jgi:hypothetical protein
VKYEPVRLPNGEDWLWRPWLRGKCAYVDMTNCVLKLVDIALMNDLLDVMDENDMRARAAAERDRERES